MVDQLLEDATGVVDRLTALDPSTLTAEQAVRVAHVLAELRDRVEATRLGCLAEVQGSGVWAMDGSRSASAWLSRQQRCAKAVAGADLKTARLLADHLPSTVTAVRSGAVPVGHAVAMTRTCLRTRALREMLADPDRGEGFLLGHAGLGLEDFRRFLNAWCYRVDPDAADQGYREAREDYTFSMVSTPAGVVPGGLIDPVVAEGLRTMLRAQSGVPAATDTRSVGQRMHDALGDVVQRVLSGGALGRHASVRPQVVVHVDYRTLEAKAGAAGMAPAVLQESKTAIPRVVLDRLMCDSDVTRVVFGPKGEVLDVGRSQRTFTKALRRALDAHDGGCMWPGCELPPEQCEGHHTDPRGWAGGATTEAKEGGILACGYHHDRIHAQGVSITRDERGNWEFRTRHGDLIGRSRPRSLEPDLWDAWAQTA